MEQLVKVRSVAPDGTAEVVRFRESACSGDCHSCAGCGAQSQTILLTANNPIGARPGDLVTIRSGSGPVLAAAAALYVLPVVLFFLGYWLGASRWRRGALVGGVAFALGILIAVLYDRLVAAKQKTVYTITGFGENEPREKGDNDLD